MRSVQLLTVGTLFILIAAGSRAETCAAYAKAIGIPKDEKTGVIVYQEVVPVEGVSAAELFARAKLAVVSLYRSAKDVTQLEDKDNGRIIAKGNYAFQGAAGTVDRMNHTLTIECRDGRYRVTISDLAMDSASSRGRAYSFDAFTAPDPCFGRKTTVKNAHQGALDLLRSVKVEMAKAGAAGTDKW